MAKYSKDSCGDFSTASDSSDEFEGDEAGDLGRGFVDLTHARKVISYARSRHALIKQINSILEGLQRRGRSITREALDIREEIETLKPVRPIGFGPDPLDPNDLCNRINDILYRSTYDLKVWANTVASKNGGVYKDRRGNPWGGWVVQQNLEQKQKQLERLVCDASTVSDPFPVLEKDSRAFTLWWGDGEKQLADGRDGDGIPIKKDGKDDRSKWGFSTWLDELRKKRAENGITEELANKPTECMLRVRVQADITADYVTLTFYIDASKSWGQAPIYIEETGTPYEARLSSDKYEKKNWSTTRWVWGERRQRIFEAVRDVRAISENRLASDRIEEPLAPELAQVSKPDAEKLQSAADVLYEDIWSEFEECFDISVEKIAGTAGEVFCNFRGVVLSTCGLAEDGELLTPRHAEKLSRADTGAFEVCVSPPADSARFRVALTPESAQPKPLGEPTAIMGPSAAKGRERFARFLGQGLGRGKRGAPGFVPNEAHAVAKAFWPFVRRTLHEMDFREYLACGVFDFRALYITALGSRSELDEGDEGPYDRKEDKLLDYPYLRRWKRNKDKSPARKQDGLVEPLQKDPPNNPVHFLLITKQEPVRRQISRLIERINSLNTARLMAIKDWPVLRNADEHIRLRGEELDELLAKWADENAKRSASFLKPNESGFDDEVGQELGVLAYRVGQELDKLGSEINKIGKGTNGGLPYRVHRSRMYAREFETLAKSLGIGNIDSWIAFDQFADRSVRPLFVMIDTLGNRLVSFRERLQSAVELVQATALVLQTSATRANTTELRTISDSGDLSSFLASFGILAGVAGAALTVDSVKQNSAYSAVALLLLGVGISVASLMGLWSIGRVVRHWLLRRGEVRQKKRKRNPGRIVSSS